MTALRQAHSPAPDQRVVSFRARNASTLQRYLEDTLLDEPVQIYFATDRSPMYAGLPLSLAIEQACKAMRNAGGRSIEQVLLGEVRTALVALQMFDAALSSCAPPVSEPRIELLLNDTSESVGLRIEQAEETVIVTPGTFIHATYNFTTSEAVSHPGSWFRPTEESIEAELLN